jgi:long-chain acyl-CoA synthetase
VTIVDEIRAQAGRRPAHPALLCERSGARVSYAELARVFDAHAGRLRAEGLAPGDRCGLVAAQGRGWIELALGVLAAGGCLVPVPDDHRGRVFDAFARRASLHRVVREEGDRGFSSLRFPDAVAVDGAGDARFRALHPAYLRFTSGTTSRRKGVVLSHATVTARLAAADRALAISPHDRILWLLPLAHHFVVSILLYLSRGATVLLPAGSLARGILDFGAAAGATLLYASPHHCRLLAKDASEQRLPALRLAVSTADGLRRDVAEAFARRFGLPVTQALGIIEVGLPLLNLARAADKPESVGRPLPDYEVWLRDEDGRPLAAPGSPERTGEVCIRGPGMLDAYLDPWLPAAQVLERGSFRTGDQGYFDAEGDLFLVGRRASRISMAGMKFFGEEVEEVLDSHPGVRESRVFAREHAHVGEIPVAELVPRDPESPPQPAVLAAFCRERLPGYKVPREFRLVVALARTSSGKLRRHGDSAASAEAAGPEPGPAPPVTASGMRRD